MNSERPLVRSWAVVALSVLHAAPFVAAFWLRSAAQGWLAGECFVAAAAVTASWVVPGLRRRIWAPDAVARGAALNAAVGVGSELSLGVLFMVLPSDFVFG